jgi:hypothetical protein
LVIAPFGFCLCRFLPLLLQQTRLRPRFIFIGGLCTFTVPINRLTKPKPLAMHFHTTKVHLEQIDALIRRRATGTQNQLA